MLIVPAVTDKDPSLVVCDPVDTRISLVILPPGLDGAKRETSSAAGHLDLRPPNNTAAMPAPLSWPGYRLPEPHLLVQACRRHGSG